MRRGALAAALAAILLWAFSAVLDGALFQRDVMRLFVPHKAAIAEAWRAGRLPVWNPDVFCGMPRLAVPAAGTWHPLNVLFLLPLDAGRAATLFVLLQYPLALAGMLVLGRRAGLSDDGALVAASAYALSGFHLAAHVNPHPLTAAAVLPWLLAASWRATARGAAAAALILAWLAAGGEAVVGWSATALAVAALLSDGEAPGRRRLGAAALFLALGLAAAAAVWLPAAAIAPETDRAGGLRPEASAYYSVAPAEVFGLFVPYSYMTPDGPAGVAALVFPWGAPLYFLLYVGAPVWWLAALGARRGGRAAALGAASAAAGLVLALGVFTPVHGLLLDLVPPLRALRFPVKHLHVAALGLALLAGLGLDRAAADPRGRRRAAAAAALGLAALGAVLALPGRAPWSYVRATFGPSWLHALVALGAAVAALEVAARRRPGAAAGLVALVVALDGAAAARPHVRVRPPAFYAEAPSAVAAVDGGRVVFPKELPDGGHLRPVVDFEAAYADWMRDLLIPQTGTLWGVRYWDGYEGFAHRRFPPLQRAIDGLPPAPRARALGAYAAAAFVDPDRGLVPNPRALARARLPARVRFVGSEAEALERIAAGHPLDEETLLLEPSRAGETLAFAGAAEAAIVRDDAEAVDVRVRADEARRLVLADALWNGWEATVDGAPAPILLADAYVRAVEVPAGDHVVSFRYRAPGLAAGIAVSLAGIGAATMILLWPRTASGTSRSSPTSTTGSRRSPTVSSSGPGRSRRARCAIRSSTRWTSSASAGSRSSRTPYGSGTSGRRASTRSTSSTRPATSTSGTRSRGRSPPSRAPSSSSTSRRGSRPRRSPTSTSPSRRT